MSEFINNEVQVSGDDNDDSSDYEDDKPIEIDKEFIDNNTFEEDVNFYRTIYSKKSRFDCIQVGKLKIDSESEKEQVEMNALDNGSHVPELDDSDDDDSLPEAYKHIYGTDNYEWNNYKRPNDSAIYEIGEEKYFLFNFQESLRIPSKNYTSLHFWIFLYGPILSSSKQHRNNRKKVEGT